MVDPISVLSAAGAVAKLAVSSSTWLYNFYDGNITINDDIRALHAELENLGDNASGLRVILQVPQMQAIKDDRLWNHAEQTLGRCETSLERFTTKISKLKLSSKDKWTPKDLWRELNREMREGGIIKARAELQSHNLALIALHGKLSIYIGVKGPDLFADEVMARLLPQITIQLNSMQAQVSHIVATPKLIRGVPGETLNDTVIDRLPALEVGQIVGRATSILQAWSVRQDLDVASNVLIIDIHSSEAGSVAGTASYEIISTDGTVSTTDTYLFHGLDPSIDFGGIETWLSRADEENQSDSTYAPTVIFGTEPVELTAEIRFDIEVLKEQLVVARNDQVKKDYHEAETLYREIQDALGAIDATLRPFNMEMIQYYVAQCLLRQMDARKLNEARKICESVIEGLIVPLNSESEPFEVMMVDGIPLLQQVSFILAHLQYLQSDFKGAESTCKNCLIVFGPQEGLEREYGLRCALMSRILEKQGKQGPARVMLQRVPDDIDWAEIGEPLCVELADRTHSPDNIVQQTTSKRVTAISSSKVAKRIPRKVVALPITDCEFSPFFSSHKGIRAFCIRERSSRCLRCKLSTSAHMAAMSRKCHDD